MRKVITSALTGFALIAVLGCDSGVPVDVQADDVSPSFTRVEDWGSGGAIVSNTGLGQDVVNCSFRGFFTNQGTAVASPSGNGTLSCLFEDLEPIAEMEVLEGWLCFLNQGAFYETRQSSWRRHPDGHATLSCQFNDKPLNNAAVTFAGDVFEAQEGTFTEPLFDTPSGRLSAEVVYVGTGCFWDPLYEDPEGKIALIERGFCFYADKLLNVQWAGAVGAIVFNSEAGGEGIVRMIAPEGVAADIPGVFVARSSGLTMLGGGSATVAACANSKRCRDVF